MEWSGTGTILSVRRHGETSAIVELLTRDRGRHLGLVRGGRSRRMRPVLQQGNSIAVVWRARLSEHLGHFTVEPEKLRAATLMEDRVKLAALSSLCQMAGLLPERDAHAELCDAFGLVLDALEEGNLWPALLVRWELGLLEELGFGLDLTQCAASGRRDNLIFVSTKSAKAVCADAGAPYRDRLLALPPFLAGGGEAASAPPSPGDILAGFALTGYFFRRHVWAPRGLEGPRAREEVIAMLSG